MFAYLCQILLPKFVQTEGAAVTIHSICKVKEVHHDWVMLAKKKIIGVSENPYN